MILALCSSSFLHAYDFEVDGIAYKKVTDSTLYVTYKQTPTGDKNAGYSGDIIIPEKVCYEDNEYTVTGIYSQAFYRCSEITSVQLPNTIIRLYGSCFNGCSGLTQLLIPESVLYISNAAFSRCSNIKVLNIPNGIQRLEGGVFYGCSSLKKLVLPGIKSVSQVGAAGNFDGCKQLEDIIFLQEDVYIDDTSLDSTAWFRNQPDGSIYIGKTYYKYKGIINSDVHVDIKEGTLSIAGSAFRCYGHRQTNSNYVYDKGVSSVTLPDGLRSIGNRAFAYCKDLSEIKIPKSVFSIGSNAFRNSGLKKIVLPEGITTLSETFQGCDKLESVVIPSTVNDMYGTFHDCYNLKVVVSKITEPFHLDSEYGYDYTFTEIYRTATLYIPDGTYNMYSRFDGWRSFLNIVEGIPHGIYDDENNSNEKCEKPTILYSNGKLLFECKTEGVEYHWNIINDKSSSGTGSEVLFTPKFTVNVYASKEDYKDSDIATMEISGINSLKGDVNNNGNIDIGDAVTIVNYLVGKTTNLSRSINNPTEEKNPQ